ncbi:hypothetical protein [Bosea sp. CRIB-10]|uniref:hypothetical protein n=1 Tax=Bosea sp. CRIB-10 TaxID=378404 RepID=UPI001587DD47|nr:hypothetical protein [Bosea sp. CRIB-10]
MNDRRIFFLGVNTGFLADGKPDERYLRFYATRSSSSLHCAIIGNVVVPGGYGSNAVSPTLTAEPVWTDLAAAIRRGGSMPGIQLATAWEGYAGSRRFVGAKPHEIIQKARQLVTGMGRGRIAGVLDSFEAAAAMAERHGFSHIQLHAAHGYLLGLLVDSRINSDSMYVLERLATLAVILRRAKVETSIRISLKTGEPNFDNIGTADFQDTIARLPFDYIDLSSGFYNIDKRLIYPTHPNILAARLNESLETGARHPDRAFILSGRAIRHDWTKLPSNVHLGLCRDLIANPNFLQEPHSGCHNHNKCHYYSRGSSHLTCGRWLNA